MTETFFAIPGELNAPTGGYAYDRRLIKELRAFAIDTHHIALPGAFPHPDNDDIAETVQLLAATPEDATLLIDGLAYGAMPTDALRKVRRRTVVILHHPLALETGLPEHTRTELKTSEIAALALADHVIATSPYSARLLHQDYGVPQAKITFAEPGTDPAQRATGTAMPMQLLAVGAISKRKGYDILIDALVPLADQLPWRLTITGAQDRFPQVAEALQRQIGQSGLQDQVNLAGVVVPATLNRFYDSADLFVMPSLFEGYGMVLAEAMARGLPIICTTGGAASETVPDAAAIKVAPGDADQLRDALHKAMTDKKLRSQLADASWDAGRTLPTWQETARRVAAVILDLKL
ncbi:MAG: glycosyltransferase family 4 protein [Pseudomonadota bacterium]